MFKKTKVSKACSASDKVSQDRSSAVHAQKPFIAHSESFFLVITKSRFSGEATGSKLKFRNQTYNGDLLKTFATLNFLAISLFPEAHFLSMFR